MTCRTGVEQHVDLKAHTGKQPQITSHSDVFIPEVSRRSNDLHRGMARDPVASPIAPPLAKAIASTCRCPHDSGTLFATATPLWKFVAICPARRRQTGEPKTWTKLKSKEHIEAAPSEETRKLQITGSITPSCCGDISDSIPKNQSQDPYRMSRLTPRREARRLHSPCPLYHKSHDRTYPQSHQPRAAYPTCLEAYGIAFTGALRAHLNTALHPQGILIAHHAPIPLWDFQCHTQGPGFLVGAAHTGVTVAHVTA